MGHPSFYLHGVLLVLMLVLVGLVVCVDLVGGGMRRWWLGVPM